MLGIQQYKKLQELKALGLSKLKVSEQLNLSYKTVCNWWDRDEEFFNAFQKEHEFILL
jgi:orotate phosphoribosyltransferase-like protein